MNQLLDLCRLKSLLLYLRCLVHFFKPFQRSSFCSKDMRYHNPIRNKKKYKRIRYKTLCVFIFLSKVSHYKPLIFQEARTKTLFHFVRCWAFSVKKRRARGLSFPVAISYGLVLLNWLLSVQKKIVKNRFFFITKQNRVDGSVNCILEMTGSRLDRVYRNHCRATAYGTGRRVHSYFLSIFFNYTNTLNTNIDKNQIT